MTQLVRMLGTAPPLSDLAGRVDARIGYPKYWTNPSTNQVVYPDPGSPATLAFGVTVRWDDVRYRDPEVEETSINAGEEFAYAVDEVSRPHVVAILAQCAACQTAGVASDLDLAILALTQVTEETFAARSASTATTDAAKKKPRKTATVSYGVGTAKGMNLLLSTKKPKPKDV